MHFNSFIELVLKVFLAAALFLSRLDVLISRANEESSTLLPGMGFVRKTFNVHSESGIWQPGN